MENNLNESELSKAYLAKCLRRLKEWGAPLEDWRCVDLIDMCEGDDEDAPPAFAKCDLCDCHKVRYVHVMDHPLYFDEVRVGCICAGIMEGDVLAAKERERLMKNRSQRRKNFVAGKWKEATPRKALRLYTRTHKGQKLWISVYPGNRYYVRCDEKTTSRYKGQPIDNFYSAVYAAFDLADPLEDIL